MKSILISIKPEWVVKILNGEKTIEIRKTMPKCELPIDVYIYCTKDKTYAYFLNGNQINSKIVAKFTLNKVEEVKFDNAQMQKQSCLTEEELFDYLFVNSPYCETMRKGYAWHIDDLEVFDIPKEIKSFTVYYRGKSYPQNTSWKLMKAPQSWCYVEELK